MHGLPRRTLLGSPLNKHHFRPSSVKKERLAQPHVLSTALCRWIGAISAVDNSKWYSTLPTTAPVRSISPRTLAGYLQDSDTYLDLPS
jgi:hypothetical protein